MYAYTNVVSLNFGRQIGSQDSGTLLNVDEEFTILKMRCKSKDFDYYYNKQLSKKYLKDVNCAF